MSAAEPLTLDRLLCLACVEAGAMEDPTNAAAKVLANLTPAGRLTIAAEQAAALPHGAGAYLTLGVSAEAVELLRAAGAEVRATIYSDMGRLHAIDKAELLLDGLRITAQGPTRKPTAAETEEARS